ncbi:MAG: helix-turn-helix transcriptional regulator [Capsulimonadaceae bacterium]|nr:helix-turn-helix transcriptional regulator [Capsulimonadaceae bacterium]
MRFASIESLTAISHSYNAAASSFRLPVDTYQNWAVLVAESGRFEYHMGNLSGVAGLGDVVLCPPGVAMERRVLTPLSFHFVEFSLYPPQESETCTAALVADLDRLNNTFTYLRREASSIAPARLARVAHFVRDIIFLCDSDCRQRGGQTGDSLVADVSRKLRERALEGVALREVAAGASLSPVQLVRRFHAAMGQTPREYVEAIRLQHARTMLVETDNVLDVIAHKCGYRSAFYLSRLFKQRFGVSPSEFRSRSKI